MRTRPAGGWNCFVAPPVIRFPESAEGVKRPKREHAEWRQLQPTALALKAAL
jgi:hypothetical protein